jgi:WD40 repeat protein
VKTYRNHRLLFLLFLLGLSLNLKAVSLKETWNTCVLGKSVGYGGIIPIDYNNDGKKELFCTTHDGPYMDYPYGSYWYVLAHDQVSGQYLPSHVSEVFEKGITASGYTDFDGDKDSEYAIGTANGTVVLYGMPDLSVKHRLQVEYPDTTVDYYGTPRISMVQPGILRFIVADADNDGIIDFVVHTAISIVLYDRATLKQKRIIKVVSKACDIGNVNNDARNETVLSTGELLQIMPDTVIKLDRFRDTSVFRDPDDFDIRLVDTDKDSIKEILNSYQGYLNSSITSYIGLFDAVDKRAKWLLAPGWEFSSFSLFNVDSDSLPELIVTDAPGGPPEDGGVHCFDVEDTSELWHIPIADDGRGSSSPVIADVDGDKKDEIIFVYNRYSSAATKLLVHDLASKQLKWQSTPMGSPIYGFYVGDANNDGKDEYLIAPHSDGTGFADSAHIMEFDASTHQLRRIVRPGYANRIYDLHVGDIDTDGKNELVISGIDDFGALYIVDAATYQQKQLFSFQYMLPPILSARLTKYQAGGAMEIVAGCSWVDGFPSTNYTAVARISASGTVTWKSDTLPYSNLTVSGIETGDFNNDGSAEIVTVGKSLLIHDGKTQAFDSVAVGFSTALDVCDFDKDSDSDFVVGTDSGRIVVIDARSNGITRDYRTELRYITALRKLDFSSDPFPKLLAAANGRLALFDTKDSSVVWQSERLDVDAGKLNRLFIYKKQNTLPKVILPTRRTVREFELDTTTSSIKSVFSGSNRFSNFLKSATLSKNGLLKIVFRYPVTEDFQISLLNISGRKCYSTSLKPASSGNIHFIVDKQMLASQVFLLDVKSLNNHFTGKLLLNK